MVKKILSAFILLYLIVIISTASAQDLIKIGTINSKELLESVPGKKEATKAIDELNQKYKNELSLMQNDYNNKYTDFLANQNNLAESIKLRRMQELYELEQNITKFITIAQEDVNSQENIRIEPLKIALDNAVKEVGTEYNFTCIYDMANPAISFITPNAIDANSLVKAKLQRR